MSFVFLSFDIWLPVLYASMLLKDNMRFEVLHKLLICCVRALCLLFKICMHCFFVLLLLKFYGSVACLRCCVAEILH